MTSYSIAHPHPSVIFLAHMPRLSGKLESLVPNTSQPNSAYIPTLRLSAAKPSHEAGKAKHKRGAATKGVRLVTGIHRKRITRAAVLRVP